ncbi:MAG: transposase family protein [Rhodobacteraceae bacterium]|nr:transposase family protein [Paracoccaceae bacterium]
METFMGNSIDKTDDQRTLAIEHANILRPLMYRKADQPPLTTELAHAAETMGVSLSTAKRMFHRLKEGDGRASALEPLGRGPKKGGGRLNPDVEAIIDANLQDRFLVQERPSLSGIVQEIRLECLDSGLKAPTRRTIKARLDAIDQRKVVRKRQGPKAAREQFSAIAGEFTADLPLEIVQVDHTLADIILVDSIDREAFRRPWVTFAIDVATRVVTGIYVTFDAPSTLSVALCLEHATMDKSHFTSGEPGYGAWPSRGLPHKIHVDNAKEFHSRAFSQACAEWGIELDFRPPGRPHYGGILNG